ncbi:hypothetical protein Ga0074812_104302 [Parafrankia irregularis]|uniref:Uncharacterized protein n=1 Tax=Parafrankia irregularis TaxID=795642 RepID=A0A0S4QI31_9ACTN|nr:hypothetical protein Ga0074812_104302 [Parafrankia irregularis]
MVAGGPAAPAELPDSSPLITRLEIAPLTVRGRRTSGQGVQALDIRPRQLLLEIWKATTRYSFVNEEWMFGGRNGRNSISDAEQLLCIMYPGYQMAGMGFVRPDETARDVAEALAQLGDCRQIPHVMVRTLLDYMERYSDEKGNPSFAGGSYFQPERDGEELTVEQLELEVVDSFSMSITLSLAVLGFVKELRPTVRRASWQEEMNALETAAAGRLTAAMVGTLRSFTVRSFTAESEDGRELCDLVNVSGSSQENVLYELRDALAQVRASLSELTMDVETPSSEVMEDDTQLFECGWTWGITRDAPPVEVGTASRVSHAPGVAEAKVSLYFTLVALDGITDLFSDRTKRLNLITPEQQGLARALRIRLKLAQRYWATIARFGRNRWALEEIPWRGRQPENEGTETDYESLLATSITVEALTTEQSIRDVDIERVAKILEQLARRGRVTGRARQGELAITLHDPGIRIELTGAETLGPPVAWQVADFSTTLLKSVARTAYITRDSVLRDRLVTLADQIWSQHLQRRQVAAGPNAMLWDNIGNVFNPGDAVNPGDALASDEWAGTNPSWYFTERVMESLVAVAGISEIAPYSKRLADLALEMLTEADHLHACELLRQSWSFAVPTRTQLCGIETNLRRAREIRELQPATAIAILQKALRELDALALARWA